MTEQLEHFKELMSKLHGARQASSIIYDPKADPGQRMAAYAVLRELGQETGLGELLKKVQDSNNQDITHEQEIVNRIFAAGIGSREHKAYGYFEANQDSIISARDARDGLAKKLLQVPPVKTGNSAHDERVAYHNELLRLRELGEAYKDRKIGDVELAKNLEGYVENIIENAFSVERDPDNIYVPDRFKDNVRNIALGYLLRGSGEQILQGAINKEGSRLEDRLPDNDSKANYVMENIRALSVKGEEGRAGAAETIYRSALENGNNESVAGRIGPGNGGEISTYDPAAYNIAA